MNERTMSEFPDLPPPPASPLAKKRTATTPSLSLSTFHRNPSSLPPPPNVTPQKQLQQQHMEQSSSSIFQYATTSGANTGNGSSSSNYAKNLARSCTIDELRNLHRQAMNEAEAKQTELRLVLASRYRELVGSSDEVAKMRERAQELDELVSALPTLMEKLLLESNSFMSVSTTVTEINDNDVNNSDNNDNNNNTTLANSKSIKKEGTKSTKRTTSAEGDTIHIGDDSVLKLRQRLSTLPRLVHRALDKTNVYEATKSLIEIFRLISEQTDEYDLATALSSSSTTTTSLLSSLNHRDVLLESQMRLTFLHVQTLPAKIIRISKQILNSAASFGKDDVNDDVNDDINGEELNPKFGAERSASALSALDMLTIRKQSQNLSSDDTTNCHERSAELLDLYFDSKAKLLRSLLNQLNTTQTNGTIKGGTTINAESILSRIVLIVQYDIILHPYQIFVLKKFPTIGNNSISCEEKIHVDSDKTHRTNLITSLPIFSAAAVQAKASSFLSAHLPLIRTKVKNVLVDIAGTTASALGKIRQSLYDKTDGVECMRRLNDSDGICTWDEAVASVVDIQGVLISSGSSIHIMGGKRLVKGSSIDPSTSATPSNCDRRLSLWSVLFSTTFSSLVHSLLTTSFQSVHTKLVSTLRLSLTNAPPLHSIVPHEAYRNTLHIASQLDTALLKVSDDANELLVHAEERTESERRLRQSLYVQTCEIMGQLICELRCMLLTSDKYDAVKQLIVGRLCHLLKFRLTALSTLLDPNSSPAVLHGGTTGVISIMELSSAYELADDNEDGLITFEEATEAVDSAFSGTQFHGAEMVRETLLLPAAGTDNDSSLHVSTAAITKAVAPQDVTLDELTLLLARGLRHETSGRHSALGAIQNSLDRMIESSFQHWAREVLKPYSVSLSNQTKHFVDVACTLSEDEYRRMYLSSELYPNPTESNGESSNTVTNVSPHIISYLVNISFTLNRSVCPSDALLPVPSKEYALAMGMDGAENIPRMIDMIRWALLLQGLEVFTSVVDEHVGKALQGTTSPAMKESGPSGIAQLKNDLSFVFACFYDRNQYTFDINEPSVVIKKKKLKNIMSKTDILFRQVCTMNTAREIERKREYVLKACDLFISPLFGEDSSKIISIDNIEGTNETVVPRVGATPLFHPPLVSSCRFPLLPIQADRTLSGVQARGKYKKEESDGRSTVGSGAVRAGFGFFSSMLKSS